MSTIIYYRKTDSAEVRITIEDINLAYHTEKAQDLIEQAIKSAGEL